MVLVGENGVDLAVQLLEGALHGVWGQRVIVVFTDKMVACGEKKKKKRNRLEKLEMVTLINKAVI